MKQSLLVAALLSLFLAACDGKTSSVDASAPAGGASEEVVIVPEVISEEVVVTPANVSEEAPAVESIAAEKTEEIKEVSAE